MISNTSAIQHDGIGTDNLKNASDLENLYKLIINSLTFFSIKSMWDLLEHTSNNKEVIR